MKLDVLLLPSARKRCTNLLSNNIYLNLCVCVFAAPTLLMILMKLELGSWISLVKVVIPLPPNKKTEEEFSNLLPKYISMCLLVPTLLHDPRCSNLSHNPDEARSCIPLVLSFCKEKLSNFLFNKTYKYDICEYWKHQLCFTTRFHKKNIYIYHDFFSTACYFI